MEQARPFPLFGPPVWLTRYLTCLMPRSLRRRRRVLTSLDPAFEGRGALSSFNSMPFDQLSEVHAALLNI